MAVSGCDYVNSHADADGRYVGVLRLDDLGLVRIFFYGLEYPIAAALVSKDKLAGEGIRTHDAGAGRFSLCFCVILCISMLFGAFLVNFAVYHCVSM